VRHVGVEVRPVHEPSRIEGRVGVLQAPEEHGVSVEPPVGEGVVGHAVLVVPDAGEDRRIARAAFGGRAAERVPGEGAVSRECTDVWRAAFQQRVGSASIDAEDKEFFVGGRVDALE